MTITPLAHTGRTFSDASATHDDAISLTGSRSPLAQSTPSMTSPCALEEADEHCDRVVVIGDGRLLADGSPASIKASMGLRALRFSVHGDTDGFDRLPAVRSVEVHGRRVELLCTDTDTSLRALLAQRADAYDIEVTSVGLEDAFVTLTNRAHAA